MERSRTSYLQIGHVKVVKPLASICHPFLREREGGGERATVTPHFANSLESKIKITLVVLELKDQSQCPTP